MIKSFFRVCLFLFLTALVLPACGDGDNRGNLKLHFTLKYNGQDLKMFEKYAYPDGKALFFNRFSFFIANVSTQNGSSSKVIKEIDYLDLTNGHTQNIVGTDLIIENVTEGTYTGLNFALGVPQTSNDKTPAQFTTKPLSTPAEYWGDWKSYIFTRTEGQIDFDNDGKYDESFSLHTGANGAFRNVALPTTYEVRSGETSTINIEIDLFKQFKDGSGKLYDIETNPQIHSRTQDAQVTELINNLVKAFTVK